MLRQNSSYAYAQTQNRNAKNHSPPLLFTHQQELKHNRSDTHALKKNKMTALTCAQKSINESAMNRTTAKKNRFSTWDKWLRCVPVYTHGHYTWFDLTYSLLQAAAEMAWWIRRRMMAQQWARETFSESNEDIQRDGRRRLQTRNRTHETLAAKSVLRYSRNCLKQTCV